MTRVTSGRQVRGLLRIVQVRSGVSLDERGSSRKWRKVTDLRMCFEGSTNIY